MKAIYNECGFNEEFEPDEFGVNYFQAIGTCPDCDNPLVDETGSPTNKEILISIVPEVNNGQEKS